MRPIRRKLCGGYAFKRFDGQPEGDLVEIGVPTRAVIDLKGLSPLVSVGDKVPAGHVLAEDSQSISSPVIASISGVVDSMDSDTGSVTIVGDGSADWELLAGAGNDWKNLSGNEIGNLLYRSGVSGLGADGIPTLHRSCVIDPNEVEHLVVSAVADDIYNVPLDVLLAGDGLKSFCDGLSILRRLMPNAKAHVAVSSNYRDLTKNLQRELDNSEQDAVLYSVPARYPQGHDAVLVSTILKRPYPHGYRSANVGVIVLDTQAVLHVYDAVAKGKPLIERSIALAGLGFSKRPCTIARIGAPYADCIEAGQVSDGRNRIVADSVMTGAIIADPAEEHIGINSSLVILLPEDTERQFMAFVRPGFSDDAYALTFAANYLPLKKRAGTNLKGEERPCVSCGYCQEVCPVGIIPHLLYKYTSRGILDECLVNYRIFNCIDCNLCSYVCPSKIGVAKHIKQGKKSLLKEGVDNSVNVIPVMKLKGPREADGA